MMNYAFRHGTVEQGMISRLDGLVQSRLSTDELMRKEKNRSVAVSLFMRVFDDWWESLRYRSPDLFSNNELCWCIQLTVFDHSTCTSCIPS